jgi:hypothetical protein
MLRLDELLIVADGKALRLGESLLKFGSKFIVAHGGHPEKLTILMRWG